MKYGIHLSVDADIDELTWITANLFHDVEFLLVDNVN